MILLFGAFCLHMRAWRWEAQDIIVCFGGTHNASGGMQAAKSIHGWRIVCKAYV